MKAVLFAIALLLPSFGCNASGGPQAKQVHVRHEWHLNDPKQSLGEVVIEKSDDPTVSLVKLSVISNGNSAVLDIAGDGILASCTDIPSPFGSRTLLMLAWAIGGRSKFEIYDFVDGKIQRVLEEYGDYFPDIVTSERGVYLSFTNIEPSKSESVIWHIDKALVPKQVASKVKPSKRLSAIEGLIDKP